MRRIGLLSIAIPCYNEKEILPVTHERLAKICASLLEKGCIRDYEIVYVDNGSSDETADVLYNLFCSDTRVKVVRLNRNFGYQTALCAGLWHARGDAAVTIDADLQDPPEKIEEMIAYFEKGFDLVLGVRRDRSTDPFGKRFFSGVFYRGMKLFGVRLVHNHGDFRLMSKSLVDDFNASGLKKRFIRTEILRIEPRCALVYYKRSPREYGSSKFNFAASFLLACDAVVSNNKILSRIFSRVPQQPLPKVKETYIHNGHNENCI